MGRLRIGIAGVGGMGQAHLRNYLGLPELAEVVALADPVPQRREGPIERAATNLDLARGALDAGQVRAYDDWRGLCDDDGVDAVCLATPSDLHADAAVACLRAGKCVFCEKPMALGLDDAERMLDAARRAGRTLMIGHVLRFWPTYVKAKEIIDSGRHGRVLAASMRRYCTVPGGWFAEPARSGGPAVDLHLHDVDAALWFWGEPARLTAAGAEGEAGRCVIQSRWEYGLPGGKVGAAGPIVQFECFWDAGTPFGSEMRIVMEEATLWFAYGAEEGLVLVTPHGRRTVARDTAGEGLRLEDEYFLRCAAAGRAPERCPPEASLLTLRYALRTRCLATGT